MPQGNCQTVCRGQPRKDPSTRAFPSHPLWLWLAHGSPKVFPSWIVGISTQAITERGDKGWLRKIRNKMQWNRGDWDLPLEKTAARLKRRGDNRCPILVIPEAHILRFAEHLGISFTQLVLKIKPGQLERLHFQKRSAGKRKRHFLRRGDLLL